jgi:hypothetical protein
LVADSLTTIDASCSIYRLAFIEFPLDLTADRSARSFARLILECVEALDLVLVANNAAEGSRHSGGHRVRHAWSGVGLDV